MQDELRWRCRGRPTRRHRRATPPARNVERQRRLFANLVNLRRDVESDSDAADRVGESVLEVMRSLPERQRAAPAQRYLDGCTVGEVAVELDIEYAAAESLLARGRRNVTSTWKERDV